jgi:hypothetical protein
LASESLLSPERIKSEPDSAMVEVTRGHNFAYRLGGEVHLSQAQCFLCAFSDMCEIVMLI